MTNFQIPSKKEANYYIRLAKEWVENHPESSVLNSTRVFPYIIVGEYIANLNNHTILIIKRQKEKKMAELLKLLKNDLQKALKREIEFRRDNITTGTMFKAVISIKNVVRSIISMFPEIGIKPN